MIEKMKMMEQTVPTHLTVKVNGEYEIFYKELNDCFGYEFRVFPALRGAFDAVKEVVEEMESQSYDHGSSWRATCIEEIQKDDPYAMYRFFRVKFRNRDSN